MMTVSLLRTPLKKSLLVCCFLTMLYVKRELTVFVSVIMTHLSASTQQPARQRSLPSGWHLSCNHSG
jgi:hypothetical protein